MADTKASAMSDEIADRMRDRIARTRRIIELAHNEEMIGLLKEMIAEAEADIRKMEAAKPKE